jgi:hypothetical protein
MASSAVVGFGAVRRGRLRAGAAHLAVGDALRLRARAHHGPPDAPGAPAGDNRVWIEDTEDAHVLDPNDPLRRAARPRATPWRPRPPRGAGHADLRAAAAGPARGVHPTAGARYRERTLEDGVVVTRLYAHTRSPATEGNGHIYFFPGGVGERAVVHLRGADGEIYSVTLTRSRAARRSSTTRSSPRRRRRARRRRPQRGRPARAAGGDAVRPLAVSPHPRPFPRLGGTGRTAVGEMDRASKTPCGAITCSAITSETLRQRFSTLPPRRGKGGEGAAARSGASRSSR